MNIQPLNDRVLIKCDQQKKEQRLESGIYISQESKDSKDKKEGTIVAVGTGKIKDDGSVTPLSVKKGDKVIFSWGDKIVVDDQEYEMVREEHILGIITH